MGIPDHLTSPLRNTYAGQEATVRTGHGITDWFQIGKVVHQGCILSPCLFNLYAEYIMRKPGLEEAQDRIKMPAEISITSGMQMTPPLWQKVKRNSKASFTLMKVKEERGKVGLKLNIQKMNIMASGPITSWEIDGETVETVSGFIFWGSQITADGDFSHEIKRHLLLGRKVMTNLDSIFKSRDITLPTKVCLVMAMVFPVVMYGCESCTVKKAEHQIIDAFELWCWRRLLRVLWTAFTVSHRVWVVVFHFHSFLCTFDFFFDFFFGLLVIQKRVV
uniref:Reverse transcriptase domain-containing protein n=1 Tax=Bos mutus grunniens TaxID=30521 RepID=A0A8B9WFZ1_BOSMU